MSKKESAAVAKARLDVELKTAELGAARAEVDRIGGELSAMKKALDVALLAEDAKRPCCRLVTLSRHSQGEERNSENHVILRKTPTGILVTRPAGQDGAKESRFKFAPYLGRYVPAERTGYYSAYTRELRDVPSEYMPASA